MQVNRSPSFHTDAPLDKEVKEGLLWDTLNLLDLFANDKRKCMDEEKRRVRDRLLNKQRSKDSRYSRKRMTVRVAQELFYKISLCPFVSQSRFH